MPCDESCIATQTCVVCHKRKKPVGRSAPLEMANGLCDDECDGYRQDPKPGHYWSLAEAESSENEYFGGFQRREAKRREE